MKTEETTEAHRAGGGTAPEREIKMFTFEEFQARTSWKMSYAEYVACCCERCTRENCPHRDAFRRVPLVDGGLALCPNLRGLDTNH